MAFAREQAFQQIVKRHPSNPILTPASVPFESKLTYNAGVLKLQDRFAMVFRSDRGWDDEKKKAPIFELGLAWSGDGIDWEVEPDPILGPSEDGERMGVYDPRLSWVEGRVCLTYAQLTEHGVRGAIDLTDDLRTFEPMDRTVPDNRNLVVFPNRIQGDYWRMERPFPILSRDNKEIHDIWISRSPDLVHWGRSELLLCVEDVEYANVKLGAGTPPVWTEHGWLSIFHAVSEDPRRGKNGWEDEWKRVYCAGVLLQALDDPAQVLGYSKTPLMAPEASYETEEGFRHHVIFPSGLVLEDGTAKIYYGAADSVVCLATARVDDLVAHALKS